MSNVIPMNKPRPIVETMVIPKTGGYEHLPVGTARAVVAGKVPISTIDAKTWKILLAAYMNDYGITV
jgi:hypothetical protein